MHCMLVMIAFSIIAIACVYSILNKKREHFYPGFQIPPIVMTDTVAVMPPSYKRVPLYALNPGPIQGEFIDESEPSPPKKPRQPPASKNPEPDEPAAKNPEPVEPAAKNPEPVEPAAKNPEPGNHGGDSGAGHAAPPADGSAFQVHDEKSSLHQAFTDGEMLSATKLDPIFKKLDLPSSSVLIEKLTVANAYNPGQPPEKKLSAAYLVLATLGKLKVLPAEKFATECPNHSKQGSEDEHCNAAGKAYGLIKYNSVMKNENKVEELLTKYGANKFDLTPAEMMTLWSTNEHHNLHCCLIPGGVVGNAVHMTSLNNRAHVFGDMCQNPSSCKHAEIDDPVKDLNCDWPEWRTYDKGITGDGSLCKDGWFGGYNDTGRHWQGGWYRDVMKLKTTLGLT